MRPAIDRAGAWLSTFPEEKLRFDAAIGTGEILKRADGPALRAAHARARAVADRDADNPARRFFDPAYRTAVENTSRWEVPKAGQPRVNPNRLLDEALYCREFGVRDAALDYAAGPMRDGGGYHATHAAWGLIIARDNGCLKPDAFARLSRPVLDELRGAQPAKPGSSALDVDLFAERALMLALAGEKLNASAAALIDSQREDGSWGTLTDGEDPYRRYHATMISAWALAQWL